jgi:hypothetical protein
MSVVGLVPDGAIARYVRGGGISGGHSRIGLHVTASRLRCVPDIGWKLDS